MSRTGRPVGQTMANRMGLITSYLDMLTVSQSAITLGLLLPEIMRDFRVLPHEAGTLFLAVFSAYLLFVLIAGRIADRIGQLRLIRLMTAGLLLAAIAAWQAPSFSALRVALFFIGGFAGTLESLGSSYGVRVSPSDPTRTMNLLQIFFGIGAIASSPIAALWVEYGGSWRLMYLWLAFLSVLSLAASLFASDPGPAADHAAPVKTNDSAVSTGRRWIWDLLPIALMLVLYCGAESGLNGWLANYLQEAQSVTRMGSALLLAAYWAAMTVGRVVCQILLRRIPAARLLIVLLGLSVLPVLPLGLTMDRPLVTLVLIMLTGFLFSSIWPLLVGLGQARVPGRATVVSFLVASGGMGAGLMPYAVPWIALVAGSRFALSSNGILILAAFILALLSFRRDRPAACGSAPL